MPRTTVRIGLAALAPVVVLAAVLGAVNLRDQNEQLVSKSLDRARELNAEVDRDILVSQSALRVLADSQFIAKQDWPSMRARSEGVMRTHADWKNVILTDVGTRRELWDMRSAEPRPMRPAVGEFLNSGGAELIGNLAGDRPDCPCVIIHQPITRDGKTLYVLSVEINPDGFQKSLLAKSPKTNVGAIVDRNNNFIARTLDYDRKRGTPATHFVRDAKARAPSGVYEGVTWEGLKNRTAYANSALTGYSTHIALPRTQLNMLGAGSAGLSLFAFALALLTAILGAAYAVREQRRWQRDQSQRVQAQKMAAIGQFASGFAHDFNNLLTIIIGNLERLKTKIADSDQARSVEHAIMASERGVALVDQLLSFAREKPIEVERVDLASATAGLQPLLVRTLGGSVRLIVKMAGDMPPVKTNKPQFETALLNLAGNARDAMPNGGSLTIEGRRSADKGYVDLLVRDTGQGMPADVAARALDPFFTTKEPGKGTGLGLAQVQSLMLQSDGRIEITSRPGDGTDIVLKFLIFEGCA